MKWTKKTLGIVALGVALAVPAFIGGSQIGGVSASASVSTCSSVNACANDALLTDEQIFADAYKGLTSDEVKTYVGYLDEKDKVNANIDALLANDGGKVTDQTSAKFNKMIGELDRLDKELFLLEKKSWVVLEKERINGFVEVDEFVKKGLTDKLTSILDLETKAVKSELTPADKTKLDNDYREFIATISYFDTVAEVSNAKNLTDEEKDKLLEARLKVNEINREIAELDYDENLEVAESDKATNAKYEAEIDRLTKDVIKPLHDKAGLETATEKLVW